MRLETLKLIESVLEDAVETAMADAEASEIRFDAAGEELYHAGARFSKDKISDIKKRVRRELESTESCLVREVLKRVLDQYDKCEQDRVQKSRKLAELQAAAGDFLSADWR